MVDGAKQITNLRDDVYDPTSIHGNVLARQIVAKRDRTTCKAIEPIGQTNMSYAHDSTNFAFNLDTTIDTYNLLNGLHKKPD
jgi:hypothetical protein